MFSFRFKKKPVANEDDASDDLDGEDGVEDLVVQLKPEDVVNRVKAESIFQIIQLRRYKSGC